MKWSSTKLIAAVVALVEPRVPEGVELGERRRLLAQPDLDLEGLFHRAVEALDDAAPLADVGLAVHQVDLELGAREVESPRLIAGPVVDVDPPRRAPRGAQSAERAAHGHQILAHAVARVRHVARAVVDEGLELATADLAAVGAHPGARVDVADHEVERLREAESHVPLGAEHVHHAATGRLLVEVAVERRALERSGGHLAGALHDVDERRRRARGLLLAQLDDARERRG